MDDKITALLHGYAQCIDDEQYERWPELFTDDGYYKIITREGFKSNMAIGIMECRNKGMMKDRIYSMTNANIFAPHHYRHLLSAPIVQSQGEGIAEVKSSFGLIRIMADGASELFLSGAYLDKIDTTLPEYRFKRRIVVLDSSRIDTLIVAPV